MRASAFRVSLIAVFVAAMTVASSSSGVEAAPNPGEAAVVDEAAGDLTSSIARMDAFFARNPELAGQSGTGWKPYNRLKWFREGRVGPDGTIPAGARWRAGAERRARESLETGTPRAGWFNRGPTNFSGRMLDIEFDPNDTDVVYAGAAGGGLWKSMDGAVSWTPITDHLPTLAVNAVCVLPWDSNTVLIGTGEGTLNAYRIGGVGILKSTDAGATWGTTALSYPVSDGHGFHIMEANAVTGTILAGATDGLWRSTDDGETWTDVKTGGHWFDVKWKPGDPSTVYAVKGDDDVGNGVKISTDDGLTWAKAGTGQPSAWLLGKTKIAVTPANPEWIYAGYAGRTYSDPTLVGIYLSTDGGGSWSLQADSPNFYSQQGWYNNTIVVDPNDETRVFVGGVSLYRSQNSGVSWGTVGGGAVHVDHHAAVYRPGTDANLFVGSDGGVWESVDDGQNWMDRNTGLVTYQFYDICVSQFDAAFMGGGTQDNGTDRWFGSTVWQNGLFADGMVCNINPANSTIYAEIQNGVHYKSFDGGDDWTPINNGIDEEGRWVTPVAQDQNAGNHLYTATVARTYRTTNGGSWWDPVGDFSPVWIDISRVDGNVVWTVAGTGVIYSTNDGLSWNSAADYGFDTGSGLRIHAHPTDVNTAFVTFSSYADVAHMAMTTDLGASWIDITGDLPPQPVNVILVDPQQTDRWFIGTDTGVWASTDGGSAWIPFDEGLPNTVVMDLEIQESDRKLVAGTFGRGAWEVDIAAPLSTGAGVALPGAPAGLMLDAPRPNPVTHEALFRYASKRDDGVVLDIYDVAGRLVNRLAEHPRGDGIIRHAVWMADDVPNGVYFAVLRSGGVQMSRKVTVTR